MVISTKGINYPSPAPPAPPTLKLRWAGLKGPARNWFIEQVFGQKELARGGSPFRESEGSVGCTICGKNMPILWYKHPILRQTRSQFPVHRFYRIM